jgi:hypothetical protein
VKHWRGLLRHYLVEILPYVESINELEKALETNQSLLESHASRTNSLESRKIMIMDERNKLDSELSEQFGQQGKYQAQKQVKHD